MTQQELITEPMDEPRVEYKLLAQFPGYRFGSNGSVWSSIKKGGKPRGHWLKLKPSFATSRGYSHVSLRDDTGQMRQVYVHRLILEAFLGPCPPGMYGCHGPDHNPNNNRLDNLRWDTPKANQADRRLQGTYLTGERHPGARHSLETVLAVRKRYAECGSPTTIAQETGISIHTIEKIVYRVSWNSPEALEA